jgi:hypothetical protein
MDAYFEAMQAEIKPGDVVLDQSYRPPRVSGDFSAQYLNRRRRAIIFRSGGVVRLEGSIPRTKRPRLAGGCKGAGPLGGGRANTHLLKQGFPPQ